MAGYTRTDTTNNIADGNIINATDLDNEFDGIQAAFNSSTGHNHDGTTGEGAPILVLGPTQDVVVGAAAVTPKTTNTVDLGSGSLKFKDLFLAGNGSIGGTLAVTGVATLTAQPVLSSLTASSAVATDASKGLVSVTNTGTGNNVLATSPTLVTPALGTPSSATLTNATGLPVATGISGLGTGVATFLATPSSANLAAAVTDETGSGALVFATSPTLVTPALGTPSSGTVTNLTGTASININGTVGATTPTTGAFTTLSATGVTTVQAGTAALPAITTTGDTNTGIFFPAADTIAFSEGGAEAMRLDSSGNVGLGVTPSPWISSGKAIDIGGFGSVAQTSSGSFSTNFNCYQNSAGNWIYKTTNAVSQFQVGNAGTAAFAWYQAASGTAGNAITFTQAMTLNASGNLGIGTSSPNYLATLYKASLPILQLANSTSGSTAADGLLIYLNGANATISNEEAGALNFQTSGLLRATLDSSGNLGIGTSSPDSKLHVVSGASSTLAQLRIGYNGTSVNYYDANTHYFRDGSGPTNRMILDSSGNFGLGVTPSAWNGIYKAMQFGPTGAIYSSSSNDSFFSNNAFWNAANSPRYLVNAAATYYYQNAGAHTWATAASGTAGNAISFSQAMTLDASGRLGIGTSSPGAKLNVVGTTAGIGYLAGITLSDNATTTITLGLQNPSGSDLPFVYGNSGLGFGTNSAERARIDSSGNLLVGTTSAASSTKLDVLSSTAGVAGIGSKITGGATTQCYVAWNDATSGDNVFHQFYTEGGGGTLRGSITYNRTAGLVAYNTTSDYRAKDISGPVTGSGALIDSVPVYMGKMKNATQERPMFIAHEVPAYAHTGEKDAVDADGNPVYQQMDASALIPVMWAEIQSLRQRLAAAGI